ncbi:MAG TPA: L,D-transpeptidase [Holophagaceae bacterium]|nr:L,D-transpeptidase [Holophagaceae bacterium]
MPALLPPPAAYPTPLFRMDLPAARARLRAACAEARVPWPLHAPSILIEKGARRLTLLDGGRPVAVYHVGLGASPGLDKEREGDHRTPEGTFYLCSRNAASPFHLFLGISYPGPEAASRGLRSGLITKAQADAIRRAWAAHGETPQFTPLGGLVGIHGGGSGRDWTWGCIALENAGIEELWVACPLGTPVEIRK